MILLLALIGIFTYFLVQRSVANVTRTPVWLLTLVMMLPAFTWTAWIAATQRDEPPPWLLLMGAFILSSVLYWFLVQWGRIANPSSPQSNSAAASSAPPIVSTVPPEPAQALRPIAKEEEATLQSCFPWSVYYLQNIEFRPQALICRGQLRTSPEVAYKTIKENIENKFADRFLVVFQEGLNGKPFFALVPNPQAKTDKGTNKVEATQVTRPVLALGLFLATLFTTTVAGAVMQFPEPTLPRAWSQVLTGLPYGLALMAILGSHEFGHYWTARRYKLRATLPYFIPVPPAGIFPFGTFGAFIQMRSPIPNRKALFDIGLAGPLSGFVVTVPLLIWGLANSTPVALSEQSGLLNPKSFDPQSSLLIALLTKLGQGGLDANTALVLHPVAIAGCLGLVITALNLMPVGQLDGGHIVHAMFGQRTGSVIGQVARILVLALAAFVHSEFWIWAIWLFFIPIVDEPALNDVTELDNRRDFLGLLALAVLVAIILPAPSLFSQLL